MTLNSKWLIYITKAAKVLLNCPANMLPKSTLHKWIKIFSPIKNTRDMILHSDLGSQYTSDIFENYLSSKGIKHSFSRKGNPYDNTCIESFHSLLKKEMIYCNIIPLEKPNPTFSNILNPGIVASAAILFLITKLHRRLKIML